MTEKLQPFVADALRLSQTSLQFLARRVLASWQMLIKQVWLQVRTRVYQELSDLEHNLVTVSILAPILGVSVGRKQIIKCLTRHVASFPTSKAALAAAAAAGHDEVSFKNQFLERMKETLVIKHFSSSAHQEVWQSLWTHLSSRFIQRIRTVALPFELANQSKPLGACGGRQRDGVSKGA
jgi:hypothetical protein